MAIQQHLPGITPLPKEQQSHTHQHTITTSSQDKHGHVSNSSSVAVPIYRKSLKENRHHPYSPINKSPLQYSGQAEIIQRPLIPNSSPKRPIDFLHPSNIPTSHSVSSPIAQSILQSSTQPPQRRASVFSCTSTARQSPTSDQKIDCFEIKQRSDSKLGQRVFVCISCLLAFTGTDDAIENHKNSTEHTRAITLKKMPKDPVSDKFRNLAQRNIIVGGDEVKKLVCIHCKALIAKKTSKLEDHIYNSASHQKYMNDLSTHSFASECCASPKMSKADIAIKNSNGVMCIIERDQNCGKCHCTLCDENIVIVSWDRDVNIIGHERSFKHQLLLALAVANPENTHAELRQLYTENESQRRVANIYDYLASIEEQNIQFDGQKMICTICKKHNILELTRTAIDRHVNTVRHEHSKPKLNGFNQFDFNYHTTQMLIASEYEI